jgi:hypothetical protein
MIKIIQSGKSTERKIPIVHAEWQHWMDESVYTHAQARQELGLANGTFYRRIAKAPSQIDRLAMRALFEGLEPFA